MPNTLSFAKRLLVANGAQNIADLNQHAHHGRRKGARGGQGPPDFDNVSKKGYFIDFEWEKTNFTTFGSPWKNLKILPTPMTLTMRLSKS